METSLTSRAAVVWALFAVLLGVQALKVQRFLPVETLANRTPIVEFRYTQIFQDVQNDRRMAASVNRSWAYDPFIGAGQLIGPGFHTLSNPAIFLDRALLRAVPVNLLVKLLVWGALLMAPALLFFSVRLFRLGDAAALIAMALSVAGCLGYEAMSKMLIVRGFVGFWLGAYVAVFNASALYAAADRERPRLLVPFALSLPVLFILDCWGGAVQAVPIVLILACAPRSMRGPVAAAIGAAVALTLLANWFWLVPFDRFQAYRVVEPDFPAPGWAFFKETFFPQFTAEGYYRPAAAVVRAGIAICGLGGIALLARRGFSRLLLVLVAMAEIYAIIALAGDRPPWHNFEPGRFPYAASILLIVPASAFLAATLLRPATSWIFVWTLWLMVSWQTTWHRVPLLGSAMEAREAHLVRTIQRLPADRRILLQQDQTLTDGLRLGALTPNRHLLGFSGGGRNTLFARSAAFSHRRDEDFLFGRKLTSYRVPGLLDRLRRYNVGYVIATQPSSRTYFLDHPEVFRPMTVSVNENRFGIWVFEVREPGNGFMIRGEGTVRPVLDGLTVELKKPGRALLSFHWFEGLQVTPPATARPVYLPDDPLPFIQLENAPDRVELRYEN